MIFRNIISIRHEDKPNEYIIRQSKYILFFIVGSVVIALTFLLVLTYWTTGMILGRSNSSILGNFVGGTMIIILLAIQLIIRGFLIARLVGYFYSYAVIDSYRVVQMKFTLFFTTEVNVAELYRVLSISSTQSGILQSTCNFGHIDMQLQNDSIISIKNVPNPKRLVQKIEELKESSIEQRLYSEDIDEEDGNPVKQIESQ